MENNEILIVDDDVDLRTVLRDALTTRSYKVTEASDGSEGLQLLQERSFHLVLSDVVMPDMDGIEFLRNIKKIKKEQPVILMSGNMVGQQFFKAAQLLGADLSLQKPFTIAEMIQAVKTVLD